MKKVALFLLLIPLICTAQYKLVINTDIGTKTDTCLKGFRYNGITSISFDFSDLRSDTTTMKVFACDWDDDLDKYIPTDVSTIYGYTSPIVLSKATHIQILDSDLDWVDDTSHIFRLNTIKGWPSNAVCFRTEKQDSGLLIIRITR